MSRGHCIYLNYELAPARSYAVPNLFVSYCNLWHFMQRFGKFTLTMVPNAKTMPLEGSQLDTMNIDLATLAFIANNETIHSDRNK